MLQAIYMCIYMHFHPYIISDIGMKETCTGKTIYYSSKMLELQMSMSEIYKFAMFILSHERLTEIIISCLKQSTVSISTTG